MKKLNKIFKVTNWTIEPNINLSTQLNSKGKNRIALLFNFYTKSYLFSCILLMLSFTKKPDLL